MSGEWAEFRAADLDELLGARLSLGAQSAAPSEERVRKTRALRRILFPDEFDAVPEDLLDLVVGDRLVIVVDDIPSTSVLVNIFNFVWGLSVLPKRAGGRWLLWNLDNLRGGLGRTVSGNSIVRAVEQVSAAASDRSWFARIESGEVIRGTPASRGRARPPWPAVITIPAFNYHEGLRNLLDELARNAELFAWEGIPVVVFDASSDPKIAEQNLALVRARDSDRLRAAYVGARVCHPSGLKSTQEFVHSLLPIAGIDQVSRMFNPSVGGNLNTCFSYFGPDATVLNFDHDVLPSVEVPVGALLTLGTSDVPLSNSPLRMEVPAEASEIRRLPVDFLHSVERCIDGRPSCVLTGDEMVEGDNESYKLIQLSDASPVESEYLVAHICGIQDHSARFLLDSVLERGLSLRDAAPERFVPARPVYAASVSGSKLITTTLTMRRHGLDAPSLGFVGTSIRVQDFVTGAFHRTLSGRPILWAPVYLTHDRRYGLRGEARFGEYLLNEDYMRAIREMIDRLHIDGRAASLGELRRRWQEVSHLFALPEFIDKFLDSARGLTSRLKAKRVDETYDVAADSIARAYGLRGSGPRRLRARDRHQEALMAEIERVSQHLEHREAVNSLGRQDGLERLAGLSAAP